MSDMDKSVKSLSDEEWNSMVSVMGKYKGYPVLALKALLLAVINGEPHRRKMNNRRKRAAVMYYKNQGEKYNKEYNHRYYLEHKAERNAYNREYRKRNREAYNARIRAYRARKKLRMMNGEAGIVNEA